MVARSQLVNQLIPYRTMEIDQRRGVERGRPSEYSLDSPILPPSERRMTPCRSRAEFLLCAARLGVRDQ
jgi:hypothetical protein